MTRRLHIVAQGVAVVSEPGTPRQSNIAAWPAVMPSGRWIIGYRAADQKASLDQHVRLTWSDDEGKTWSASRMPLPRTWKWDGREGNFRTFAPTPLGDGRLLGTAYWVDRSIPERPFWDPDTESLLDAQLFTATSEDDGTTWSLPRHLETGAHGDFARVQTGPTLVLPDGRWMCQYELNKRYEDPRPWCHKPVVAFSYDHGESWSDARLTASDPANEIYFWDQRPAVLADGRLLDLFWTYDRRGGRYRNIHASESMDHGRSWSALWDTGVPGQPAPPVSLPDGGVLMVRMDRTAAPKLVADVSVDGGRTFSAAPTLEIDGIEPAKGRATGTMAAAWEEMSVFRLGLPATAPLEGGDVLVTWYHGQFTDATDIRWARLAWR